MMALVKSKRYWTGNLIIFAVAQFLIYMLAYYIAYKTTTRDFSGAFWRILSVVVIVAGIFSSNIPAITRFDTDKIRLNNGFNYGYLCVFIPFIIYFLYYIGLSYINWTFEFSIKNLNEFCISYLCLVPAYGVFLLYCDDLIS
ncbi:hypothetical protein ACP3S7_28210 [Phytobacter ursingii]